MKPEELFRLAMCGPTVDELSETDRGSGAGREEDVRGTQRAAHGAAQQVKSKGRGPLVLSGYVHDKPFYLYKDGTSPTPSKVGRAAAEAGGSRAPALVGSQKFDRNSVRGIFHGNSGF